MKEKRNATEDPPHPRKSGVTSDEGEEGVHNRIRKGGATEGGRHWEYDKRER